MEDKQEKPHLSVSQIEMYTRCPEQYRRRYIEKHIIPPGIAFVRGISFHKGAEYNFKQKINTKQDLPVEQVKEVIASEVDYIVKNKGVLLTQEEEKIGKKKVLGKIKDEAVSLGELFIKDSAPYIQPVVVEDKEIIEIPEASYNLMGVLDVVDEKDVIIDFKTSSKSKSQEEADKSLQLTMYALTFRKKFKRATNGLRLEVFVAKKEPEIQRLTTHRTVEDVEAFVNRVNSIIKGIKAGVFPPATPGAWWCDPRFCGYYYTCKYVSKGGK